MGLHGGAINEHLGRGVAGAGKRVEEINSHPLDAPADMAVIERLPRSISRRCVDPETTGLEDVDDPADHTSVVDAWLAMSLPPSGDVKRKQQRR